MTNLERMLAGKIYDPSSPEIAALQQKCHALCLDYNSLKDTDVENRCKLIKQIFPDSDGIPYIQGNLYVDYGCFTKIGKGFYANWGLTILDTSPVTIGENCYFGPNVAIYTPLHPLKFQERNAFALPDGRITDKEYSAPITIGDNCWIAGSVTILAGVTIGNGCVIGAGSVVVKSIPDNCLAVGNPCKVVREITDKDSIENKPEIL